jgi:hypothetical protein
MPFKRPHAPDTPEFLDGLEQDLRRAVRARHQRRWLARTRRGLARRLRPALHGGLAACLVLSFSLWGYQQGLSQTSTTILAPPGGILSAAELSIVPAWVDPPPTAVFRPEVRRVDTPQTPAEEPLPFRIA